MTRLFSYIRAFIALVIIFVINAFAIAVFLPFILLILHPERWGWVQSLFAFFNISPQNVNAYFYFVLLIPFLLLPLSGWLVSFFSGYRTAKGEDKEYMQECLETILERSGLGKKRYNLYVEETDEVNACAFGIRNICVTRGTLNVADNDPAFLKGILAHEMGHLSYRHTIVLFLLMVIDILGNVAISIFDFIRGVIAIGQNIPVLNLMCFLLTVIFNMVVRILNLGGYLISGILRLFARMDEHAADYYACEIGFGKELCYGLQLLYEHSGPEEKKGFLANIKSDHPSLPHRIETIKKYLEKHENTPATYGQDA